MGTVERDKSMRGLLGGVRGTQTRIAYFRSHSCSSGSVRSKTVAYNTNLQSLCSFEVKDLLLLQLFYWFSETEKSSVRYRRYSCYGAYKIPLVLNKTEVIINLIPEDSLVICQYEYWKSYSWMFLSLSVVFKLFL